MKKVVSISLGSAKRNHSATLELMDQSITLQRIGTDGNMAKMIELIREYDGKVDAFGLGGIDLYIQAVDRRYTLRDGQKIAAAAKLTPIVDGSGLKNTLERRVVRNLQNEGTILQGSKKVLVVSAMDRFGLAHSLREAGCDMRYGDLVYVLNIPLSLKSLHTLAFIARLIVPIIRLLPFQMLYPTGKQQEISKPRYPRFFLDADIIAGDFHFIKRYMPPKLPGKTIITNTVTAADVELLREIGVKNLVTTTPEIGGRSFGTNVMEAMLVAYKGGNMELKQDEYEHLLDELNFKPRVMEL